MWFYAIVFIISLAYVYSAIPKPETQPPPAVGQFEIPTAEVGRDIPVLFGTKLITGSNVVWYGDLGIEPIIATPEGGKK